MKWSRIVRAVWPFGRRTDIDGAAAQACSRAAFSAQRAQLDFRRTAQLRAENDAVANRLRAHNEANRYDDWLRGVVQGRD